MFFSSFYSCDVETALGRENCTLEEVLSCDSVLTEAHGMHRQLLDFLGEQQRLDQMLDMILSDPPEPPDAAEGPEVDSFDRLKKCTHVASELLNDIPSLYNVLLTPPYLRRILQLPREWKRLPPTHVYYFRLFHTLSRGPCRGELQKMIQTLYAEGIDVLAGIFKHVGSPDVYPCLFTLLTYAEENVGEEAERNAETRSPSFADWALKDGGLAQLALGVFSAVPESGEEEEDEDRKANVFRLLYDILQIRRNVQQNELCDAVAALQTWAASCMSADETPPHAAVPAILECMFRISRTPQGQGLFPLGCDCLVLIALQHPAAPTPPGDDEAMRRLLLSLGLHQILDRAEAFKELLLDPPALDPIQLPSFSIEKPLGVVRLKICWLLRALSGLIRTSVIQEWFVTHDFVQVLMELFAQFPQNTVLHNYVSETLGFLSKGGWELCQHLTSRVPAMLVRLEEEALKSPDRPASLAHVYSVARMFAYGEDFEWARPNCEGWTQLVEEGLAEFLRNSERKLGGGVQAKMGWGGDEDLEPSAWFHSDVHQEVDRELRGTDNPIEDPDVDSRSVPAVADSWDAFAPSQVDDAAGATDLFPKAEAEPEPEQEPQESQESQADAEEKAKAFVEPQVSLFPPPPDAFPPPPSQESQESQADAEEKAKAF
eukprot:Hpha_TRINITY_DN16421_c2_g2::TRINITY_DN16421_c2_g2_i1::g.158980::m.158980/K15501/PPP6R3, SAPS3; serine/threonine-protein phosphatase 6 regulatory subunit 3